MPHRIIAGTVNSASSVLGTRLFRFFFSQSSCTFGLYELSWNICRKWRAASDQLKRNAINTSTSRTMVAVSNIIRPFSHGEKYHKKLSQAS